MSVAYCVWLVAHWQGPIYAPFLKINPTARAKKRRWLLFVAGLVREFQRHRLCTETPLEPDAGIAHLFGLFDSWCIWFVVWCTLVSLKILEVALGPKAAKGELLVIKLLIRCETLVTIADLLHNNNGST